ncbi:MAG: hypothetical protein ACR2GQ_09425 [Gemmatimonadota bacterium]
MRDRVLAALWRAIDEVNLQLAPADRLSPVETEKVLADGTKLDSLGFVSLVVAIEQAVEQEFGNSYSLLGQHEPSPENPVYADLGSLASTISADLGTDASGSGAPGP